jgi:hypothetical protein
MTIGVITTDLILLLISPQPSTEHIVVYLLSTSGISISKLALFLSTFIYERGHTFLVVNTKEICSICKKKITEHSELQDKICRMITIKQFANNSPGFDVQFRPFFDD